MVAIGSTAGIAGASGSGVGRTAGTSTTSAVGASGVSVPNGGITSVPNEPVCGRAAITTEGVTSTNLGGLDAGRPTTGNSIAKA